MSGTVTEINVVYTPGSVGLFSVFVPTLLAHSAASFRLVSNGCLPPEQRHLAQLCAGEPRLEFWAIPTATCLDHGQALNYLHALTRTETFAFMDSDIFAGSEFGSWLRDSLDTSDAVFTGLPLWVLPGEEVLPSRFRSMVGSFSHAETGENLGVTYFACYDYQWVTLVMQRYGVGFEGTSLTSLSDAAQRDIEGIGLRKDNYDTGKALNLLLAASGATLAWRDVSSLCHLGGASFQVGYDLAAPSPRQRAGAMLDRTGLRAVRERWRRPEPEATSEEEAFHRRQRRTQRDPARQYLLAVMRHAGGGRTPPPVPSTGVPELDRRLAAARDQLVAVYAAAPAPDPRNR